MTRAAVETAELFELVPGRRAPGTVLADPLRRAEWQVEEERRAVADRLLDAYHYLGALPAVAVATHGMRPRPARPDGRAGECEGVAQWTSPASLAAAAWACPDNPGGVLVLARLCAAPWAPANASSFLLAGSVRQLDRSRWPVLLTYSDPRHGHTGVVYRAAGWTDAGLRPGGDAWLRPDGQVVTRPRGPGRVEFRAAEARAAGWTPLPRQPKRAYVLRSTP